MNETYDMIADQNLMIDTYAHLHVSFVVFYKVPDGLCKNFPVKNSLFFSMSAEGQEIGTMLDVMDKIQNKRLQGSASDPPEQQSRQHGGQGQEMTKVTYRFADFGRDDILSDRVAIQSGQPLQGRSNLTGKVVFSRIGFVEVQYGHLVVMGVVQTQGQSLRVAHRNNGSIPPQTDLFNVHGVDRIHLVHDLSFEFDALHRLARWIQTRYVNRPSVVVLALSQMEAVCRFSSQNASKGLRPEAPELVPREPLRAPPGRDVAGIGQCRAEPISRDRHDRIA